MKKMQKGFTLVELIVVITILAILGTIAFISLQGYSQDARNSKITSDVRNLTSAIETGTTDGTVNLSDIVTGTGSTANRVAGTNNYGSSGATLYAISTTTSVTPSSTPVYKTGDINLTALRQSSTDFTYEETVSSTTVKRDYVAGVLIDSRLNGGKGYIVYQVAGQIPNADGRKKPIVKGNWYTSSGSDLTGLISEAGQGDTGIEHDTPMTVGLY